MFSGPDANSGRQLNIPCFASAASSPSRIFMNPLIASVIGRSVCQTMMKLQTCRSQAIYPFF
jgi:hypothetical protein